MYKFYKPLLLLLLVLGLTACALIGQVTSTPLPPVVITNMPTSTATVTPTVAPTATAMEVLPTQTPEIPLFNDDDLKPQVDRLAANFMKNSRNSGLSIAVVLRDPASGQLKAMLLNYGTIYKDSGDPISSSTIYELGSITKLFTGILLAEAVNSGEIKLTDPIQAYLPTGIQAPLFEQTPISFVNLATHRSGLPRDLNVDTSADMYTWLNGYRLVLHPAQSTSIPILAMQFWGIFWQGTHKAILGRWSINLSASLWVCWIPARL
jgi:CubicO group peptidase (beta-lactamase class C family)